MLSMGIDDEKGRLPVLMLGEGDVDMGDVMYDVMPRRRFHLNEFKFTFDVPSLLSVVGVA